MPIFEISGIGLDSGRKRRRIVEAPDEARARALAESDGTRVDRVEELAQESATDAQAAYATSLGIAFKADVTKAELGDQISACLAGDEPADDALLRFARQFGVPHTQFTGREELHVRIFSHLSSPGREHDLSAWFAYWVYRELRKQRDDGDVLGPEHPVVQAVATTLAHDVSTLKSIQRYSGASLVRFGSWTAPDGSVRTGGSKDTIAYERCAAALRVAFSLAPQRPAGESGSAARLQTSKRPGCAAVASAVVAVCTLFMVVMALLSTR